MAENDIASLVICDAGPLIHLDELNSLALLRDFSQIQVPNSVWQEVQRHRPTALRRRGIRLIRITSVPPPTSELFNLVRTFLLDAGEREALCLMSGNPGAIMLTDDSAARLAAFRVRGSRNHWHHLALATPKASQQTASPKSPAVAYAAIHFIYRSPVAERDH